MKGSAILIFVLIGLFCLPLPLVGIDPPKTGVPKMSTATPDVVKPGAVVTVDGEYLDFNHVVKVFITDRTNDIEVKILKQSEVAITFKLPADVKPGRYFMMVQTAGEDPMLIEEPVRIIVELGGTRGTRPSR